MFALLFQLSNAISIGGWLAGYGDKLTSADWADQKQGFVTSRRMELGFVLFGLGLAVNIFHDDQLREIRRVAARNQKKMELEADKTTGKHKAPKKNGVDKLYMIPNTGFFRWIFYPHYVAEWVEWSGFWLIGGLSFTPGRTFVLNEIATMLPRAVEGKHWYISRFGKEKVAGRTAIIPGLL
jgi:3-oxo-5-alpha-steroid 4-dehydrogenase 1